MLQEAATMQITRLIGKVHITKGVDKNKQQMLNMLEPELESITRQRQRQHCFPITGPLT